jgi:hypothetical protein
MGKPDLDTIHEPVAHTLEDRYVVVESRVVEDSLDGGHWLNKVCKQDELHHDAYCTRISSEQQ